MALGWPSASVRASTVHLCGTFTNALERRRQRLAGQPHHHPFRAECRSFPSPTLANNATFLAFGSQKLSGHHGGQNGLIQLTDNGTVAANGGPFDYQNNCGGMAADRTGCFHQKPFRQGHLPAHDQHRGRKPAGWGRQRHLLHWFWTDGFKLRFGRGCGWYLLPTSYAVLTSNLTVIDCVFTNFNHGFTLGGGSAVVSPVFDNLIIPQQRVDRRRHV